ncbi:hypothetical protein B0H14DRAFT_3583865 [Mycena olivaceomarginata]|nr:hypothetical protein B0H14DRAFT_3583865 [Mycena olivaceomarginata]
MEAYEGNPRLVVPYTPPPRTTPGFGSILTVHSYQSNGHFFVNTTPSTSTPPVSSEYCWNTPIAFAPINTPPSGTPKRQRSLTINDENTPPTPADSHSSKKAKTSGTSTRRKPRSAKEKVKLILESIQDQGWTLGEFLHQIFDHQGRDGSRSQTHAQMVRSFLGGYGKYAPSDILTCWMTSPDGILAAYDPNLAKMYSSDTPYTEIGPVRPALTSFALQTIGNYLARGAETAVHSSSGLHVSVTSQNAVKKSGWLRIGQNTIPFVADILEHHLRPAFYLLERIAMRKPRTRNGIVDAPRKHRPTTGVFRSFYINYHRSNVVPCQVIIHALADLLFCRTSRTNLLPLARGILYFGCSVPADIMPYNCRIGTMPSYSTVYKHLEALSIEEALVTSAHGSDPTKVGVFLFDNVQNLARVRDHRIGRENHMNVGMSGLWVEAWDIINVHVFDLSDKRQRISCNERANLLVDRLFSFLDQEDADTTGYLGWLEVLVRCVTPLKYQSAQVKARLRGTAKLVIPVQKSVVHPLAPSGKKEAIPSELKVGLDDFLKQIGQTAESYIPRKLIIGGDGLSYAMVLQLQNYLQWHKDPFKSFEILEPQLQTLSAFFRRIGGARPGRVQILLLWVTVREKLVVPHLLEELVEMAKKLHHTYSTARARDHAVHDTGSSTTWARTVAKGSLWVPIVVENSSLDTAAKKKRKSTTKKKKEKAASPPCKGGLSTAVAEGDVGRLYECLKYMIFTFTGSTHSNYQNYLLETIMNLELESSPGLREALLMCQLVNLTGLPGHCEEGDYVVEFFNRLLEDITDHKSAQFDDNFIRNVISRNLRHIAELKLAWRASTGMAVKSHVHSAPHTKPELRILLEVFRTEELPLSAVGATD